MAPAIPIDQEELARTKYVEALVRGAGIKGPEPPIATTLKKAEEKPSVKIEITSPTVPQNYTPVVIPTTPSSTTQKAVPVDLGFEPYKFYLVDNVYTNRPPFPGAKPVFDFTPTQEGIEEKSDMAKGLGINWKGIAKLFKDPRADLNFIKLAIDLITNVLRVKAQQNIAALKKELQFTDIYSAYSKAVDDYKKLTEAYSAIDMSPGLNPETKERLKANIAGQLAFLQDLLTSYGAILRRSPEMGIGAIPQVSPRESLQRPPTGFDRGTATSPPDTFFTNLLNINPLINPLSPLGFGRWLEKKAEGK